MRPSPPRDRDRERGPAERSFAGRRLRGGEDGDLALSAPRGTQHDALTTWSDVRHGAAVPVPAEGARGTPARSARAEASERDLNEMWEAVGRPSSAPPAASSPRNRKQVSVTVDQGMHGADPMPSMGPRRAASEQVKPLWEALGMPEPPSAPAAFSPRNRKQVAVTVDPGLPAADPMPGMGSQRSTPHDLLELWDAVGHPEAVPGHLRQPPPLRRAFSERNKKRVAIDLAPGAEGVDGMPGLTADRAVDKDLHALWDAVDHPARPLQHSFSERNRRQVSIEVEADGGVDGMPGVGHGDHRRVPEDLLQLWQAVDHPALQQQAAGPEVDNDDDNDDEEQQQQQQPRRVSPRNRKGVTVSVPEGGFGADPLPGVGSPRVATPSLWATSERGPHSHDQQTSGSAVLQSLLGYRSVPNLPGPMGSRLLKLAREAPPQLSPQEIEQRQERERRRADAVRAKEERWRLHEEISIARGREAFEARLADRARPMRESSELGYRAQQTRAAMRSQVQVREAELAQRRAWNVSQLEAKTRKTAATSEVMRQAQYLQEKQKRELDVEASRRQRLKAMEARARAKADRKRTNEALEAKRERAIAARERRQLLKS